MLTCRNGRRDSLIVEGRVLDPLEGIDECLRVTISDGVIVRLEPAGSSRTVVAPAFVDPHVHLRTPGREDEETIATGTAAAAAGGYCAILAMPNTDPVVDSAAVLGSLVEQAQAEALVPTGFMAAISKGQRGEELTEMAELAASGAVAFTDDGSPSCRRGSCAARSSTAQSPTARSHCTRRSRRCRATDRCTRERWRPSSALRAGRRWRSRPWSSGTWRSRPTRAGRCT